MDCGIAISSRYGANRAAYINRYSDTGVSLGIECLRTKCVDYHWRVPTMTENDQVLLKIGRSRWIDSPLELSDVKNIDFLFESMVTDVLVPNENLRFTVSSIPFLYECLRILHKFPSVTDFTLDIGEGLRISARRIDVEREFEIKLINSDNLITLVIMTTAQLLLQLVIMSANLQETISLNGVNALDCLVKFPPALSL